MIFIPCSCVPHIETMPHIFSFQLSNHCGKEIKLLSSGHEENKEKVVIMVFILFYVVSKVKYHQVLF